jgi:hypothetical protein
MSFVFFIVYAQLTEFADESERERERESVHLLVLLKLMVQKKFFIIQKVKLLWYISHVIRLQYFSFSSSADTG